ncbi:hypothetical protein [Bacteroides reticulotermitis]|uniref:hypothetical protein n=1 Tax=Bacteroides reticulotermitis TaxID=1133319 RepID=UPI003A8678E7
MKTTSKGTLTIIMDRNNNPRVLFEPINGTVWLRKAELPSLFGARVQTIQTCLNSILKEGVIDVEKTCKYELYVRGNRVRYDVREVNLEVIIAMAFRIRSPQAEALRGWFIQRCLYPRISNHLPDMERRADWN